MQPRTDDTFRRAAQVIGEVSAEDRPAFEPIPEEVELPAKLAVPEVIAKLKAAGVKKVIVLNRAAQRKKLAKRRSAAKENPPPKPPKPRVFADGGEAAMLRRKARNRRKTRDRRTRKR